MRSFCSSYVHRIFINLILQRAVIKDIYQRNFNKSMREEQVKELLILLQLYSVY